MILVVLFVMPSELRSFHAVEFLRGDSGTVELTIII